MKSNEEYQKLYKSNVKIVKKILDRQKLGHTIDVVFKREHCIISQIEGDIDLHRIVAFLFDGENESYTKYIDIAIEELPFRITQNKSLLLYNSFLEENINIGYVEWLEKKVLEV